ncbi:MULTISPECIES: MFS transporter [Pseudorhizobium]|uniref:Multidrug ABC transporter ATPase n=2 Tax=Pseudorhizobium pelagicum TaxID=1509405 RepID=A0A922P0P6_9HYPH|nr:MULTISPECIES: MFS transporter [Pseudorhizobium]MBA4784958.1 MFS transporter [Hyphomicrobiales bacterium]MBU1317489.1 MFS transporter [Alphaproteobacteria bacterium]MDY6962451.1 MFS transporter [Pseudomonadota bacterium]KEQ06818.1 multidrug ABC transporter ATPase [Pseudorhizobium pelagicum]KEQ08661.1 multidrug ABC transporter ATPase [Pseudorhizobium pelagicum]|tara:strand:+ start:3380 stop:4564 length:1185 start_codon:yes stop_codon:yes gene_type:complete
MSRPPNNFNGHVEEIHWPSLIAAISAISAVGIAIGLGLPLLSIILEKRGISSTMIGLNSAMAGVAAMVAAPITTRLAHDFGVARTMLWAVVISAISALAFYYAEAFWMWFPLRFAFHGAITTLFILSEFWINAAAPPRRRGLVLGIYATVLSVGFAMGPLLFSAIGSDGILPFLIGAAAILLAAVPIYIARNESPVLDEKPERHFLRYILLVPTATAAVFVFGAVEAGGLSLFPIYALRSGFTESQGALLLTVMGVGNMIFQIPLGMYSDRLRDRRPLLAAMAVTGCIGSLMLPLLIEDWLLTAVVLLFWGGCVSGLYTVGLAHLGSRLTGADLAAANAAFVFCYAVGTVAGPQAIGASIDVSGNNGFAWALAAFFGLYVVLSIGRYLFKPKQT